MLLDFEISDEESVLCTLVLQVNRLGTAKQFPTAI